MIRSIVFRRILPGLLLAALSGPASAQLNENMLSLTDENLKSYLVPLQVAMSGTLNSAIFRTGYVEHGGFEFAVGAAAMAVSFYDQDRAFRPVDPSGFASLEQRDVPTVVGDAAGVIIPGEGGLSWAYPGGFDMEGFELAVPQLSVGNLLGTRAILRFVPPVDLGDSDLGEFEYFCIGGQHSITQYLESLPFDLAVGAAYHDFKIGKDMLHVQAMQLNATASRQFGALQPYVGLGYDSVDLDAHVEDEDYPEDAIDVSLDKMTDMHFTAGVMARLSFLAIYGEYNDGASNGFALGIDLGTMGGAHHAY
jgi:hypothetical protein